MYNTLLISAVFPPEPVVSANISYDLASSLSGKHDTTVCFSNKQKQNYENSIRKA